MSSPQRQRRPRVHPNEQVWWNREVANTPYWFLIAAAIAFIGIIVFTVVNMV